MTVYRGADCGGVERLLRIGVRFALNERHVALAVMAGRQQSS
jgi:hypothetical protein